MVFYRLTAVPTTAILPVCPCALGLCWVVGPSRPCGIRRSAHFCDISRTFPVVREATVCEENEGGMEGSLSRPCGIRHLAHLCDVLRTCPVAVGVVTQGTLLSVSCKSTE